MSPRRFAASPPTAVDASLHRLWFGLAIALRDARLARSWSVRKLAELARVSPVVVYRLESGQSSSADAAVRVANALGLRLDFETHRLSTVSRKTVAIRRRGPLRDGRVRDRALSRRAFATGLDEPYQHYQFAGRADVVSWELASAALLHIENRTRFPDFQEMAGAYNAKRAYLAGSLGERLGISRWASQTHVIAALWSSEVLHALRLRRESFRSLCPDPPTAFDGGRVRRRVPVKARHSSSSTR